MWMLVNWGMVLLQQGKLDYAIERYEKASKIDPNNKRVIELNFLLINNKSKK